MQPTYSTKAYAEALFKFLNLIKEPHQAAKLSDEKFMQEIYTSIGVILKEKDPSFTIDELDINAAREIVSKGYAMAHAGISNLN